MKTKIILVFFSLLCSLMSTLQAKKVESEQAELLAKNYVQSKQKLPAKPNLRLQYTAEKQDGTTPNASLQNAQEPAYYYVFNIGESTNRGFVIIAADDRITPVLGYCENGSYDENNLPPNFSYWLDCLQQQIAYVQTHNLLQSETIANEWNNYLNGNLSSGTSSVEPLIQTQWNQNVPYNNLCPVVNGGYSPAGCVATAMAQIMNYHQFPAGGTGESDPYTYLVHLPPTSFEVDYDWSNMPNRYNNTETQQQKDAVATLMYHCGLSVKMRYSPHESSASSSDVRSALTTYFGYDKNIQYISKTNYTDTEWEAILKEQIDLGLPVFYSGGSHAFVCDGYSDDGLFHFNWGWGGAHDGYYTVNGLPPVSPYDFYNNQRIVINIKPVKGLLSGLDISTGTLSPAFRPFVFDYTVHVDASVDNIDITGITDIAGVTITGNVNNLPLNLNDFTDVIITATDTNGNRQNYTIAIIRGSIEPVSFVWDVYSATQQIKFQLGAKYGKLCVIDWGDGSPHDSITGNNENNDYQFVYPSHTYTMPGTYQVTLWGEDSSICPVIALSQAFEEEGYSFTHINLHAAYDLKSIHFKRSEIRDLDLSRNKHLTNLIWTHGKLTTLDVSNNSMLEFLDCSDNQLTDLNLENNTELSNLYCNNNAIPLINLYNLVQQINHRSFYYLLDRQFLPDIAVFQNISIAIDTVFHGVNSMIEVNSDTTNYTINNGIITFLSDGVYTVDISNPAIGNGSVRQLFYVGNIAINKSETRIYVGNTEQLNAMSAIPGNEFILWSSSDTNTVKVNPEGWIIGIAPGTAIITATTQNGNYSAYCNVTVAYDVSLQSISVICNNIMYQPDLRPYFNPDTTEYVVYAPPVSTTTTITGMVNHAEATVTGNVIDYPLVVGENSITLTVTAIDGITARNYTVKIIRGGTNIETHFAPNLNIYPNPFTENIHIKGAEGCTLKIITVNGIVVFTKEISNPEEILYVESLPTGIYFFRVEKNKQVKTVKVIKI